MSSWQPDTKMQEMAARHGFADQWLDDTQLEHLDGVDWIDAPLPRRLHRCKAQTRGWVDLFTLVERCACGAIRMDRRRWRERNERRRG